MIKNYIKFKPIHLLWALSVTLIVNTAYSQSWNNVGTPGFSNASYSSRQTLLEDNGTLYVAYLDGSNLNLIVKKYDGSTWVNVGGVVSSGADYISFGINNNTLYIAYDDPTAAGKLSVKSFNGTTWEYVGGSGVSSGAIYNSSIAFNQGNIYVAYNDQTTNLSMKMFDGTSWSMTSENITNWGVGDLELKFWGNNPTIAYRELENSTYQLIVTSKVGTFWTETDPTSLNTGSVSEIELEIYNGTPHVAYNDILGKANVKVFDGTSWSLVGGGTVSDSIANYLSLTVNNGTPYLSFREVPSLKLRCMKYDGTNWLGLDNSKGYVDNRKTYENSLIIDPSTNYPVIAFSDDDNGGKTTVVRYENNASMIENNTINYNIYPNPVTDFLTIQSSDLLEKITITDLTGKVVYAESGNHKNIDFRDFKSGVYFVKIESEKGTDTIKILKN